VLQIKDLAAGASFAPDLESPRRLVAVEILVALVENEIGNGTVSVEGGVLFIDTAAKQKQYRAAQNSRHADHVNSAKPPFSKCF
jgi:hypothetical protein